MNKLNNILDVAEDVEVIHEEPNLPVEADTTGEVLPVERDEGEILNYHKDNATSNITEIIATATDSFKDLAELASAGQDAKAFEALAKLTKEIVNANSTLVDIHKSTAKYPKGVTINNNTQVNAPGGGREISTGDLLSSVKQGQITHDESK